MCHQYHVKHISEQCNLDRLKSGSKRDTKETPTCAVAMLAPQTNALWWGRRMYNQGSFVYLAKACGGLVFVGVHGVGCVNVK